MRSPGELSRSMAQGMRRNVHLEAIVGKLAEQFCHVRRNCPAGLFQVPTVELLLYSRIA